VLLLASGGFWLGAYLAVKLMHRRRFATLFGDGGRVRAQGFVLGILLTAGLLLLETMWMPFSTMNEPYRNETDMVRWLLFAGPVIALVFIQAGGEELFFRGYVMQQLAARFRNPVIWAFLPSFVFGLSHVFNGVSIEHSSYYVISTALFGLTAAATVWRTGGLSVAIGMHVSTNVLGFLYSGGDEFFTATPIWLSSVNDQLAAMPLMIASQAVLLAFVLSPWAPFPKAQLFARRKEIRAAP
jgi:membrane protease YdiL (CAAX protease family)